jgi:uncharacterized protein (TIRG00374 family)
MRWSEIAQVIKQANWYWMVYALIFTAVSYLLIGLNFYNIANLFGVRLSAWDLIEIGYVTYSLDSLLPALGLPGLSLQVLFMKRRGAGTSESVAPSLFRAYFSNVIFVIILPFTIIYTLLSYSLSGAESKALVFTAVFITLFAAVITLMVFSRWVREKLLHLIIRFSMSVLKKDIEKSLTSFSITFSQGIDRIRHNPKQVAVTIIVALGYWLLTAVVIWFCLGAFNYQLNYGLVLAGFLLGRTTGVITFLPGGIGSQDASMVGFYVLFGIPLAQAILVALLFRVIFYFVPFFISLGFYRHLLRRVKAKEVNSSA